MAREMTLDVRNLEPPEPLFQALDALDELEPGDTLRLVIHREPMMLFPQLQERKIPWTTLEHGHPDWVYLIGPLPERR